jgi:hyperosmotically inducible periplasmic protein
MKSIGNVHTSLGVAVFAAFAAFAAPQWALAQNTAATAAANSQSSKSKALTDQDITAAVQKQLGSDSRTRTSNIDVETFEGIVTLRGSVTTPDEKSAALTVASNVQGVKLVSNQLIVEEGHGPSAASPPPSTPDGSKPATDSSQPVTDTWITTKVKTELLADKGVKGTDVNVSTKDGVVTLAGVLDSKVAVDRAVQIAHGVKGVKSVDMRALKSR